MEWALTPTQTELSTKENGNTISNTATEKKSGQTEQNTKASFQMDTKKAKAF